MLTSPTILSLFAATKAVLIHSVNGMPIDAWWLPLLIGCVLLMAAVIDGLWSFVPDYLIAFGLAVIFFAQGFYASWAEAFEHLLVAITCATVIWILNELWYRRFKIDALGMGDAKWSALAVACFDLRAVIVAWAVGAWIALLWLGFARLLRHKIARVYFTPFLFAGLLLSLYWLRFDDLCRLCLGRYK